MAQHKQHTRLLRPTAMAYVYTELEDKWGYAVTSWSLHQRDPRYGACRFWKSGRGHLGYFPTEQEAVEAGFQKVNSEAR